MGETAVPACCAFEGRCLPPNRVPSRPAVSGRPAVMRPSKVLSVEDEKTFKLVDLDCANCAAKMEAAVQKIDGVTAASVSFMAQKMTIEGMTPA